MMHGAGLTKLIEECGELAQIAAKKLAYFDTDAHPDGKGSMKRRLEEEIADVMAACDYVIDTFRLNITFIAERRNNKRRTFEQWRREYPNNPAPPSRLHPKKCECDCPHETDNICHGCGGWSV